MSNHIMGRLSATASAQHSFAQCLASSGGSRAAVFGYNRLHRHRQLSRGCRFGQSGGSPNCVLKPTAGDMVVQNWSPSASCGLARRYALMEC